MQKGLERMWNKPPASELSMLLHTDVSVLEARTLLFVPDSHSITCYPAILDVSQNSGFPAKARIPFLALFYLMHVRNACLLTPFIVSGGLRALTTLFLDSNLQIRSQAIECFRLITASTELGWFASLKSCDPRDRQEAFRSMALLGHSPFVPNLLANRKDSFPGGSLFCLQIVAFWLSWIRFHYARNNILPLSTEILQILGSWNVEAAQAGDEEKQLALKLFQDFGSHPAVSPSDCLPSGIDARLHLDSLPLSDISQMVGVAEEDVPALESAAVSDTPTLAQEVAVDETLLSTSERISKWKELGNTNFRKGAYDTAIKCYTRAIELDPSNASLYSNRAVAHLQNGAVIGEDGIPSRLLSESSVVFALRDSQDAILVDEHYAKAYLRKAQALLILGRFSDAVDSIRTSCKLSQNDKFSVNLLRYIEKEDAAHSKRGANVNQILRAEDAAKEDVETGDLEMADALRHGNDGFMTPNDLSKLAEILSGPSDVQAEALHKSDVPSASSSSSSATPLDNLDPSTLLKQMMELNSSVPQEDPIQNVLEADSSSREKATTKTAKKKRIIEEI
eukprot:ANDGO_06307.mRNA.1 Serine/threonine-protein phosphatase 5